MSKNSYTDSAHMRAERVERLLSDISEAKRDMDIARQNFDCVCSPDEVDICIFRMRAAQAQYDTLLKQLKNLY